jgi:hypothetical protein
MRVDNQIGGRAAQTTAPRGTEGVSLRRAWQPTDFGGCLPRQTKLPSGHTTEGGFPMATLTEKVYTVLSEEHSNFTSPVEVVAKFPRPSHDENLSQFELDCRDWGLTFGIAYGIARGEDPFEAERSVTDRALAAARDAFARWGGSGIFTDEAFAKDRAERVEVAA